MACSGSSPNLTAPTWDDVGISVDNCHSIASNGDTITVTAGSYIVTTRTDITKYVIIVPSGTVTLTDNVTNVDDLITITESTAGSTRLGAATCSLLPSPCTYPGSGSGTPWVQGGFNFVQGTGVHSNPNGVIRVIQNAGYPVLITGNDYQVGSSGDFMIIQTNQGVIWANSATGIPVYVLHGTQCLNNAAFIRHKLTGTGSSWTTTVPWGTADTTGLGQLYVEANHMKNVMEGYDLDDNATTNRLKNCASDPDKNFFVATSAAAVAGAFENIKTLITAQVFVSK